MQTVLKFRVPLNSFDHTIMQSIKMETLPGELEIVQEANGRPT